MGKKRKPELDTEQLAAERTLYSSFVSAANAVSQLYTQGVQQQRRATAAASRATLEKVVSFVLRENSGAEHISKAALIQFLQQEYENADSQEVPTPQMLMPFGPVAAAGSDDQQKANRQMSGGMSASPAAGGSGARSRMMGIDEQQQQQQQHQQQQLHQQQQHQQQLEQQQNQQHQQQLEQQQHQQQQQLCHPQQPGAGADAMQMQMMNMAASPFVTGHGSLQQANMFMPPSGGAMQ